ncbi:ATP-binding protein [Fulvivirga maritima]|uniref:sensor histidine kinase n=1 Tax=Fulvivirga maritima TaxID=2904247 RepID=UPI001F32A398|nr:ATP-binding protein [Fulvivirga maritima]UII26018.1 ATP-binding protein [Fulvivirga maritima]
MILIVYRKPLFFKILGAVALLELIIYFLCVLRILPFQIDLLLYHNKLEMGGHLEFRRMALNTASSFFLCFICLFLHTSKKPRTYAAQIIAFVIICQTFFFIFGYFNQATEFMGLLEFFPMAINTALSFFLFCLSFLAFTYNTGVMMVISSPYMGSISIRRILPISILLIFTLSYIVSNLSELSHWSTNLSISLFSSLFIVLITLMLWRTGVRLNAKDFLNKKYEQQINRLTRQFATSINSFENLYIINVDEAMHISHMSRNSPDFLPKSIHNGMLITDIFHNLSFGDRIINCVSKCLNKVDKFDFNIKSDFKNKFYNVSCRSIHNNNEIIGVAIAITDVTELIEAQNDLKKSNAELEKFSYSVAHDLRSPLGIINGYSQILLTDSNLPEPMKTKYLTAISNNTSKMESIITSILQISQLSHTSINKEWVAVENIIYDIIDEVSYPYKAQKPKITTDRLLNLYGDKVLISQVFSNIISNALKYSSGKEDIKVYIHADSRDDFTTYQISDNGIGFDQTDLNQALKPFQRLESKDKYEGIGIGLAIVYKIIELHGGEVWAESQPGKGSTFFFSLPNI